MRRSHRKNTTDLRRNLSSCYCMLDILVVIVVYGGHTHYIAAGDAQSGGCKATVKPRDRRWAIDYQWPHVPPGASTPLNSAQEGAIFIRIEYDRLLSEHAPCHFTERLEESSYRHSSTWVQTSLQCSVIQHERMAEYWRRVNDHTVYLLLYSRSKTKQGQWISS